MAAAVLVFLAVLPGSLGKLSQTPQYLIFVFSGASGDGSGYERFSQSEGAKELENACLFKLSPLETLRDQDGTRSIRSDCFLIAGQPLAAFGKSLLSGRYWTAGEEDVCVLSRQAARELFGSEQAVGNIVRSDGGKLRVTGVVRSDKSFFAVPAPEGTAGFSGGALKKKNASDSSALALSRLISFAGGSAGRVMDGQFYYATARAAAFLTLAAICALLAVHFRAGKKRYVFFWLIFSAALILWMARTTPFGSDYLPTYWSDLDFFGELFREKKEETAALFAQQDLPMETETLRRWKTVLGACMGMLLTALVWSVCAGKPAALKERKPGELRKMFLTAARFVIRIKDR